MATESIWKQAQEFEQAHWEAVANRIRTENSDGLEWYQWRADNLLSIVKKAFGDSAPDFSDSSVLEVGSGPVGLVSGLKASRRVALDPLMDFFNTQKELTQYRDNQVEYVSSPGETLPFEDQSFDMVVIENVIDHVKNASGVMDEIYRVLRPNGILYLTVNCHPLWGFVLHEVVSAIRIDKGHPHTFTLSKIRRFLSGLGYKLQYEEWENYWQCRRNDWKSNSTKGKLKAISGLSEFLYTSVHRKADR